MNNHLAAKVGKWAVAMVIATVAMPAAAQSFADEEAMRIKDMPDRYYYGEGSGATLEEARNDALCSLSLAIKSVVWTDIRGEENNMESTISARTGISSFTTLSNTETIEFPYDEKNKLFRVMQYIERSELKKLAAERSEKINEWVTTGQQQEGRLEIGNALKYYFWALCLCDVHSSSIKIRPGTGKPVEAKPWLESKICNLLNSIDVHLDNIEERKNDANPYLVNLRFTIKGENVNGLDLSYFTGLRKVEGVHVKNGEATLEFPRIPYDRIAIKYEYAFPDDASLFDPELEAYFQSNAVRGFRQAEHDVVVKGATVSDFKVEQPEEKPAPVTFISSKQAPVTADVEIKPKRKLVDTEEVLDPQPFLDKMKAIEGAIGTHTPDNVKHLFTPEGYSIFKRMMESGTVRVARTEGVNRRVEQAEGYIIAKSIPVQITYKGRHRCNENIVLRFNSQGLVTSVAYALSNRAEDDIFRKNLWGMKARYAMLTFMEDYQTAFALKDLAYIKKIFASNAIIINATVTPGSNRRSRRAPADGGGYFIDSRKVQPNVRFVKRTKEQYLDYLERDFDNKNFIQIIFEDTDIAWQSGVKENVYWIELKQKYSSNIYSDVGFLSLMIDLDETDPNILVRTWTPEHLDLHEMMDRYTQN